MECLTGPVAWQTANDRRTPVEAALAMHGEREVDFTLGTYAASKPLYIDPTLTWYTFLGSSGTDYVGDDLLAAIRCGHLPAAYQHRVQKQADPPVTVELNRFRNTRHLVAEATR